MLEIWEKNKKFVLIIAGAAATLLLFTWYTMSSLDAAQLTEQKNRSMNQDLAGRIKNLRRYESTNRSEFDQLKLKSLPRVLKSIECRPDIPVMGENEDPPIFLEMLVDQYTSDLRSLDSLGRTRMPYTRAAMSNWKSWGLKSLKRDDPNEIDVFRTRIYILRNIFRAAIKSGVSELSKVRQNRVVEVKLEGTKRVLRRTPVQFMVRGPYKAITKLIGSLQQEGEYLQLTNVRVNNQKCEKGEVCALLEMAGLGFVEPTISSTMPTRRGRPRQKGRRDNDY